MLAHMTNHEVNVLFERHGISIRMEYQQIWKKMEENERANVQKMNKREKENWASIQEVKDAVEIMKMESKTLYDYQRVVWFTMQLLQGSTRNEGRFLKVQNYDENVDNYVDMEKRKLIYNIFKTEKSIGREEFEITDEAYEVIIELYKARKAKNRDYLFLKRNGTMFRGPEFSKFMVNSTVKHMSKRIGSQQLRKIIVSEKRKGEMSIMEKQELCKSMLHSYSMSEKYRRLV